MQFLKNLKSYNLNKGISFLIIGIPLKTSVKIPIENRQMTENHQKNRSKSKVKKCFIIDTTNEPQSGT